MNTTSATPTTPGLMKQAEELQQALYRAVAKGAIPPPSVEILGVVQAMYQEIQRYENRSGDVRGKLELAIAALDGKWG